MSDMQEDHLTKGHCVPCEGGTKPMTQEEFSVYLPQLPQWKVSDDKLSLTRDISFKDFMGAVSFINKVAVIAENEGHHPDMNVHDWKYIRFTLTTHAIGGLSINDFILASKIDEALGSQ